MDKKEKYINYIVGDLVKKTDIDYDKKEILVPFSPFITLPFTLLFSSLFSFTFFSSGPFFRSLSKYLKEMYGTTDEEIETIWERYKERIQSLINNE